MTTKKHWMKIVGKWQKSGLSQTAFCKTNRINLNTFYSWKNRLRKQTASGNSFIPVDISEENIDVCNPGLTFQVKLLNGLVLEFPLSIEPDSFAKVVSAARNF